MFATAISMKPSASRFGRASRAGGARSRRPARRTSPPRPRGRAAGRRAARTPPESAPAGSCRASRWHRSRPAARRAGSTPAPGWRRPTAARRAGARRRSRGSSRRRRPRCGCSSSARACARRRPGSRTRARTRRASEVRHVGRRAAHVEADDACRARAATAVRTMPTMPPAGPDRIASLPWNACASVRPPEDCMKYSRTPGICGCDLVDVAAQDRRQVGIDHRRVAAADELHQRADLVRDADLREAGLARQPLRRRARAA